MCIWIFWLKSSVMLQSPGINPSKWLGASDADSPEAVCSFLCFELRSDGTLVDRRFWFWYERLRLWTIRGCLHWRIGSMYYYRRLKMYKLWEFPFVACWGVLLLAQVWAEVRSYIFLNFYLHERLNTFLLGVSPIAFFTIILSNIVLLCEVLSCTAFSFYFFYTKCF